jgi:hypothetical protein
VDCCTPDYPSRLPIGDRCCASLPSSTVFHRLISRVFTLAIAEILCRSPAGNVNNYVSMYLLEGNKTLQQRETRSWAVDADQVITIVYP